MRKKYLLAVLLFDKWNEIKLADYVHDLVKNVLESQDDKLEKQSFRKQSSPSNLRMKGDGVSRPSGGELKACVSRGGRANLSSAMASRQVHTHGGKNLPVSNVYSSCKLTFSQSQVKTEREALSSASRSC